MSEPSEPPVIGIAGWKNSGKTTLVVRLIESFTRAGLRVASVKHTHHEVEFERDTSDTARHRRAGAREVVLVGANRWALLHEGRDDEEPTLAEILPRLSAADLVIVEGFKTAAIPKIEVRRKDQADRRPLAPADAAIIAIASDHPVDMIGLPVFDLDDVAAIAQFVARTLKLPGTFA